MPGGDHLNIIDPPGLTVMRIAGGRYRVTAAHRVVWTWMNEFAPLVQPSPEAFENKQEESKKESEDADNMNQLQVGDLVTMTIVDVFETDNQGKLLSYCPTFDNRAIHKTHQTTETLRKSSNRVMTELKKAGKSKLAKLVVRKAQSAAVSLKEMAVQHTMGSPSTSTSQPGCASNLSATDSTELEPERHEV